MRCFLWLVSWLSWIVSWLWLRLRDNGCCLIIMLIGVCFVGLWRNRCLLNLMCLLFCRVCVCCGLM